jgi:GNAT superfamily N-acetyltransferase
MTPRDDALAVRPVTEPEIPDWIRALNTGFLRTPYVSDDEIADRSSYIDPSRTLGAFDGPRCVATFRSFPQEITAVGGRAVPADAITNVTVTVTHRRRGLLTRMMAQDLAAAKERGDVVATLIAAEYRIYGRYGFGPATSMTQWEIDVQRAGLDPRWSAPEDGGRIDLVDGEDVRKLGPELHERLRRAQPGAINRDDRWWQVTTGAVHLTRAPWTEPFYAVYRAADGEVQGLATYDCDDTWTDAKQPLDTATVRGLIATTPAAERALWHHLCSIDWVAKVKSGRRAPDDLLPLLLPDPRAATITTQADWLWVRILDVVRAMEARSYGGGGHVGVRGARRGPTGGRALPVGGFGAGGVVRADHGERGTHAGCGGVEHAVARGPVGRTARGGGPGPGRTSGRRPCGRRPAAYVQAAMVPGHLLNDLSPAAC